MLQALMTFTKDKTPRAFNEHYLMSSCLMLLELRGVHALHDYRILRAHHIPHSLRLWLLPDPDQAEDHLSDGPCEEIFPNLTRTGRCQNHAGAA